MFNQPLKQQVMSFTVVVTAILVSSAVSGQSSRPPSPQGKQTSQEFRAKVTRAVASKYLLYMPAGRTTSDGPLPVIVYLHGGSLRGDDVEKVRTLGLPHRLEAEASFPFIVIAPLCPAGEIWTDADAVIGVLDEVLAKYPADRHRVYLTGHSMGGRGALYVAFRYPTRFAAVVAMSALTPVNAWATRLSKLPIWYIHGVEDDQAPISDGDALVHALQATGNDVKYSRLDHRNHSILDLYDKSEWYEWLLQYQR